MAKEIWDACDREGNPLGFDLVRGEPIPEGARHLVAEVLAATTDGRVLITQRHPDKMWGGCWEYTGGAVLKGETPLRGALRELEEETGIAASVLYPVYVDADFREDAVYHSFAAFFDPAEQTIRLQAGETVAYDLLPYETFRRVIAEERFAEPVRRRFLAHRADFDRVMAEHLK